MNYHVCDTKNRRNSRNFDNLYEAIEYQCRSEWRTLWLNETLFARPMNLFLSRCLAWGEE